MTDDAPSNEERIEQLEEIVEQQAETIEKQAEEINRIEAKTNAHGRKLRNMSDQFGELQGAIENPADPTRVKWGRDYDACLIANTEPGTAYPVAKLAKMLVDKDTAVEQQDTATDKAKQAAERGPFEPIKPGVVVRTGGHSE